MLSDDSKDISNERMNMFVNSSKQLNLQVSKKRSYTATGMDGEINVTSYTIPIRTLINI